MAKQSSKKSKMSEADKYGIFIIITIIIAIVSSIALLTLKGNLNSIKPIAYTKNINFYAIFIGIASALTLAIAIIIKSKYTIICTIQGIVLALSMYLLRYFALFSSIRIGDSGIAWLFHGAMQIIIWLYVASVILYPLIETKIKKR